MGTITITGNDYDYIIAKARRDALLEAAKLVCGDCGQGKKVEKVGDGWQHPAKIYRGTVIEKDGHVLCRAENIHTELAAKQGQDNG